MLKICYILSMKRRTFYIVAIILVCIGTISGVALSSLQSKDLFDVCVDKDKCTTVIKEYAPLTSEATSEESGLLAEASEGDVELISPNPEGTSGSVISGNTARPGVDDLSFISGEDVSTQSGAFYSRNIFIAGMNVDLNQYGVDGILFAAGNKVKSHGSQEFLAAAGATVSVDSTSSKDAFIAGNIIDFSKSAKMRDAFVAGAEVTVRGEIAGDLHVAANKVVFDGATLKSDAKIAAASIEFKGDTKIYGTLTYTSDTVTTNMDKDKIGGIKTYETPTLKQDKSVLYVILQYIRNFCVTVVSIMLFAALIAKISPKQYERLMKNKSGGKDLLIGLVSIIVLPAILLFVMFITYFKLIAAISVLAFVAFFIFGTAIAAVRFGKLVDNELIKNKDSNVYSCSLYGAIAFAIISIIPVLGGIAIVLAVLAGFGYMIGETIHAILPRMREVTGKK